jgi:hypothetical protein
MLMMVKTNKLKKNKYKVKMKNLFKNKKGFKSFFKKFKFKVNLKHKDSKKKRNLLLNNKIFSKTI